MDHFNCCCETVDLTYLPWKNGMDESTLQTKTNQLVLWNKQSVFKKKGYNCFPQINTLPFKFSWISHRSLAIMDGCDKCC